MGCAQQERGVILTLGPIMTESSSHTRRWILLGVLVVLGLALLVWGVWLWRLNVAVQHQVDAARAAGHPMTYEELRAYHARPTEPHAGQVYERAFARFVEDEELERLLPIVGSVKAPPRGVAWPNEWLEVAEQYLEMNREALEMLDEAARMGPAWFDIQFEDGIQARLAHLSQLRRSARLLRLQAKHQAQTGRVDEAVDTVVALWGVSEALADQPNLTSQLVGVSLFASAVIATEDLLADAQLSGEQLMRLAQVMDATDDGGRGLVRAFVGERAIFHMMIRRGEIAGNGALLYALRATGLYQHGHAAFLKYMNELVSHAQDSPHRNDPYPQMESTPLWVFELMVPAHGAALDGVMRTRARRDLVTVGLAAARFERERGRLPETLDELVPSYLAAVPADRFADEPIRYRRTQSGAIVYSVGPSEVDHGGREPDRYNFEGLEEADITFTLGGAQAELWPQQWPDWSPPEDWGKEQEPWDRWSPPEDHDEQEAEDWSADDADEY